MTAMRVVIVEFVPGVTQADVTEFQAALHALAAATPNLVRMTGGPHRSAAGESTLSTAAPGVTFGSFVSVWEFANAQALDEFLMQPLHRELAGKVFRRLVKRRYVANVQ